MENQLSQKMLETCPYCQCTKAVVYRQRQELRDCYNMYRNFVSCTNCSIVYPVPRVNEFKMIQHIDLADPDTPIARNDYLMKLLKKYAVKYSIKNSLDIGAQAGRFCFLLKKLGINSYGIEAQVKAVELAKSKGLNIFAGHFPDELPVELNSRKYDLISCNEAIYYFVDLRQSLDKVFNLLKDGGIFFIKFHQLGSYYYIENHSLYSRAGDCVQSMFTAESLQHCLRECGFKIKELFPYPDDYFQILFSKKNSSSKIYQKVFNMMYRNYFMNRNKWINKADRLICIAQKV